MYVIKKNTTVISLVKNISDFQTLKSLKMCKLEARPVASIPYVVTSPLATLILIFQPIVPTDGSGLSLSANSISLIKIEIIIG